MNDTLLNIYHKLPYPARVLAASLRGLQLRPWRYGPETEALVEQALDRDNWSSIQWKHYQEEQLAYVLHRAATQVPFYRKYWTERRRQGDHAAWDILTNWPILEKDTLRENPRAFVSDECNINQMYHEHTSGTTGKPLDLWWSRKTVRTWYALSEARWRHWYGVSKQDRWAILGGQLVAPVKQNRPPFWVWNIALNQLYLSSYHLSPPLIPSYLDALENHKIQYIWGYTSSIYALAVEAVRLRRTLPMKVAIANAEPVFDYQRQIIEEAFDCSVRETYGMAEIITAASECEFGHLHLWPEVGWTEIAEDDVFQPSGEMGDIIATSLLNIDMPLVRYRIGDRGMLSAINTCGCGRKLPQLVSVEGRKDDILYTADGRKIGRLDPAFKSKLPILEAQIIQTQLDHLRVKVVPAPEYDQAAKEEIITRLRDYMGSIDIIVEEVETIPRTASGKFRAVISNLSLEDIPHA